MLSRWRPAARITPKALGIIRRENALLLAAVPDDNGTIAGWRPLGGTIEFGETAKQALQRELREELGVDIQASRLLAVLENIFTHEGAVGHEVIFAFDIDMPVPLPPEPFSVTDGGVAVHVEWIAIERFQSGELLLFPSGLLDFLNARSISI